MGMPSYHLVELCLKVILGMPSYHLNCPYSKTAEAVPDLQGIKSMLSISAKPVYVELDCASVVQEINK